MHKWCIQACIKAFVLLVHTGVHKSFVFAYASALAICTAWLGGLEALAKLVGYAQVVYKSFVLLM